MLQTARIPGLILRASTIPHAKQCQQARQPTHKTLQLLTTTSERLRQTNDDNISERLFISLKSQVHIISKDHEVSDNSEWSVYGDKAKSSGWNNLESMYVRDDGGSEVGGRYRRIQRHRSRSGISSKSIPRLYKVARTGWSDGS